jgi:SAM-dependent methyltransferase
MGVDVYVFDFLMQFRGSDLGDALCLGRQGMHLQKGTEQWDIAQQILSGQDPARPLESLIGPDGYAETFLTYLGCRTVRSLDYSPFEGAQIVCDLNRPVPKGLWDRFDLIIDAGTLEHVFDIPTALRNVRQMLRSGGLFLSVNAANNQVGHGLYQFSPELFWRALAPDQGFEIEKMQLVPLSCPPEAILLSDSPGLRQEIEPTPLAAYIMVAGRRNRTKVFADQLIYQSDYVAAWRDSRE